VIPGYATPEATAAFAARHVKDEGAATGHYRVARNLTVSSLGIGTYMGGTDDETDAAYRESIVEYVKQGGNFIDTAINYRAQRSERVAGSALADLCDHHGLRRDAIVVCTKAGFLSFDHTYPGTPREAREWVQKEFIEPGILKPGDLAGGSHAMSPAYLRHEVAASLRNLGLETIDVYYIHNPETWLREQAANRERFMHMLRAAFATMEELVAAGRIRNYGIATWSGFRVPPTSGEYLPLEDIVNIAKELAGEGHHLRFIQAPFNLAMLEAVRFANQRVNDRLVPLFEACRALDLCAVASATICQGHFSGKLPPQIAELFPGFSTDAQRAIQFNRSAANVVVTLVGMGQRIHAIENCHVIKRPPAPVEISKKLLLKLA
jgi:aryl-alcohol dehydrogenase-like predicted oxidoreductase